MNSRLTFSMIGRILMGIHDRDYYRESSRGWWDRFGETPVTKWFVIGLVGLFVLQLFSFNNREGTDFLSGFGAYHLPSILDGEIWRVLTPYFLHSPWSLWHVVFNAFLLYWAGREIEAIYGSKEFLAFYLTSALLITLGMIACGVAGWMVPDDRVIGSNGPVTAVFVLLACHYPHRRILLFFILPVPLWLVAGGIVLLNLGGVIGVGGISVGNLPILIAAVFAYVYHHLHWRVSGWIPPVRWRSRSRRSPRPRLFVDEPEDDPTPTPVATPRKPSPSVAESANRSMDATDEQLEAKLDQVLEKVARYGKESLTPAEQNILLRASEVYKRRRGN